ncbi:MAG: alkaline phosphatase family protein [Deltaproteobacteria bacterium]|nr:alkaline phosphatase family protein [Deltaproteobacteria bacterium]
MSLTRMAAAAALMVLGYGLWYVVDARRPSQRQRQITAVCDAVGAADYDRAIEWSESLVSADSDGRIAAECRCWALLNRDRRDDCANLIDDLLLADPDAGWVPHPVLSTLVARTRAQQGRAAEAANLARAATAVHPGDLRLLELEIGARSAVEGQQAAHAAMEARIGSGPESLPLRIALAVSHLGHFDGASALRVLGETPPPDAHPLLLIWFENRARAIATLGDIAALKRHFERWSETGADPLDLSARYALRVSVSHLSDPDKTEIELLEKALVDQAKLSDARLRWALYRRLIGTLIAASRVDDALKLYDAALEFVSFPNLTREEIARALRGALVFRLPRGGDENGGGGTLLVSPGPSEPPDRDYIAIPIAPGQSVEVARGRAHTPPRWVFRDEQGRTRGSGNVWPLLGSTVEVVIEPRTPAPSAAVQIVAPSRAADGRRRLFALILDCADWRLIQYLRARNELPLLDQLLTQGYRAVLESSPAFTAAAMEALVWPMRGKSVSFLGMLQRMGLEIGGLASVGKNPLGFLSAVLPESASLFETIGSGEHVVANMLFSHGGIEAGHHAQMLGPLGEQRELELSQSFRALREDEISRFPGIEMEPRQRRRIETIAAEFDSAETIIRAAEVDLLVLRIEPLDLLTHAFFRDLLSGEQDDGKSPLLSAYRYIDDRLAQIYEMIDRDDVLLVMSDHGIRTAMEHETDALFVLAGEGIPTGRAPGEPHLRGVPRILAGLLGIETPWPDSGIASWVEAPPESRAASL